MRWLTRGSIVLLPLILAACGQSVILPKPTEQVVTRFVVTKTGFHPHDVSCPSGVPAKAGGTFKCHFTGPDGKYTAYMTIKSVHGSRVNYQIQTKPSAHPIDAATAEKIVATFVAKSTGSQPPDVRCPSGVVPLAGRTVVCRFTGPDGSYTASLVITSANGGVIDYRIRTHRIG